MTLIQTNRSSQIAVHTGQLEVRSDEIGILASVFENINYNVQNQTYIYASEDLTKMTDWNVWWESAKRISALMMIILD